MQQSPDCNHPSCYKAQGIEAMCQQRAQHILLPLASPLSEQRQDNSLLKEGTHWTVLLFALSIIEHLPQAVMAQLSSCFNHFVPASKLCLQVKLSAAPNKKIWTHTTPFTGTDDSTPQFLSSIVCLDPDTIIWRLHGMAVLPSLVLGVRV